MEIVANVFLLICIAYAVWLAYKFEPRIFTGYVIGMILGTFLSFYTITMLICGFDILFIPLNL